MNVRTLPTAALAAAILLAAPGTAFASSIGRNLIDGVLYRGEATEANDVLVTGSATEVVFEDRGATISTAPPECTVEPDRHKARCPTDAAAIWKWDVDGGEGEDRVDARGAGSGGMTHAVENVDGSEFGDNISTFATTVPLNGRGHGGDDTLDGGNVDDVLDGGPGNDRLLGWAGTDKLTAGPGDDNYLTGGGGRDEIDGGDGRDHLDYRDEAAAVTVDLGDPAAGSDRLSGVESVLGSRFDDVLLGAGGAETLSGGEGNDRIEGRGGPDSMSGGPGDDAINARDEVGERVGCDTGTDAATVDLLDSVGPDCEQLDRPPPPLNGVNASPQARFALAWAGTRGAARSARRRRVRFGTRQRLTVTLTNERGQPISGASVQLRSEALAGSRSVVDRQTLTSDARGRIAIRLAAGPGRDVTLSYVATNDPIASRNVPAVQLTARLLVRARLTFALARSRIPNGTLARFRGRLRGGFADGKRVDIQARAGGRWVTFASGRADRSGRYTARFRFSRTRGRVQRYQLRARVVGEPGYPYLTAASRPTTLTVVP